MNFRKKLRKGGGGHFRSEKFHCKFSAGATGLRKKLQYFFPKKGRGGSKAVWKFSENLAETGFPYILDRNGRKQGEECRQKQLKRSIKEIGGP